MNIKSVFAFSASMFIRRVKHAVAGAVTVLLVAGPTYAGVSQTPLYLGGGDVPGNLLLVPSVEWPTINSTASIGDYDPFREYLGYFDPKKCYEYSYSPTEADRHFYPVGWAFGYACLGQWSGNFMNWAATQTVDPFRSVLTGGLRVRDTATETWLEKARHSGQGGDSIYPDRRLPASGDNTLLMVGATPFSKKWMRMQIDGRGNKMRFRFENDDTGHNLIPYDPAQAINNGHAYEVSVRVAVCVPGLLEANCRAYPSGGFKPEGLIQQYADEIRFGIFGYLLDSNFLRDGGVLRARQGFVGQTSIVPGVGEVTNPNAEWDPFTGVLVRNPDPADAAATSAEFGITINDSGLINYLNKFGQMTNGNHKSYDPNSELYYAAVRYLKNQGNVPEYTELPGNTSVDPATAADGFPIITNWDDPIEYACQKNVMLGIGDVYTHRDKNLPGSSATDDEPAMPASVSGDTTLDVVAQTQRVADLEGITINTPYTGRQNSAFIAGMAWYANTHDLRPGMPGTQTASTHWVDVLEGESLEPTPVNQYYLAAKYGGFRKPDDFDHATVGSLDFDWWHSNGEILTSFGSRADFIQSFARPDNYYLAGGADQMIDSLTEAFANIAAELRSSATSVATNSTRLGADTAVFQASFDSTKWSGDVQAYRINTDGTVDPAAAWSAATKLDALSETAITNRNILTITPPTPSGGGSSVSTNGRSFNWGSLSTSQQDELRKNPLGGPLLSTTIGQDRLEHLRGSRLQEQPIGLYRERDSRLGDIVNSDPQFVHKQDFGYALLDQAAAFSSSGAGTAYIAFRQSSAYQNRVPMVILSANDGMLHGFDASLGPTGGDELFAFVPDAAIENMYELTLPGYSHRFFVDGSPRAAEIWTGSAWRTIVVGTTGAGGSSVFALDVTDPSGVNSSSVLWEFTHPDMGYTIGQPSVVPLPNGKFGVVVTSGYETGSPDGTIWILDPNDGSIIKSITVDNSGDLGPPLVVDLNNDRVADRIYTGDTFGNLWRFDLDGSNTSDWRAPSGLRSGSTPLPLFVARDGSGTRRAITAPLTSAINEDGLHTVFFGTGSFYRVDDNVVPVNPDVDAFFGVVDTGAPIAGGRAELLEQSILVETTSNGRRVRAVTDNQMSSYHKGWYLDLKWDSTYGGPGAKGERVVSRALVRNDRVIFATLIPSEDPCAFGGDSWLMELNTFTGGRLDYALFDLNSDGQFDDDDWIDVTLPDGSTGRVPPSAIAPDVNIIKTPAVITGIGPNDDEVKVVSGSGGQLMQIMERGSTAIGRLSWRQMR